MNMEISKEVKEIMYLASVEAELNNDSRIHPEHIGIGLLTQDMNIATMIMVNNDIKIDSIFEDLNDVMKHNVSSSLIINREKLPTKEARNILMKSEWYATTFHSGTVSTEHLLLALLSVDSETMKIFNRYDVNLIFIKEYLSKYSKLEITQIYEEKLKHNNMSMKSDDEFNDPSNGTIEPKIATRRNSKTPFLDEFSRDITQMAIDGNLQMVFGRDKEIDRISQILSRKNKRNPILVGEAGVGKSVIVDGLAMKIADKTAPKSLHDKKIISIEISNLVAGTKYRGQFEERMKGIMQELKNNPHIIAFIDEIHTMVGAGSTTGSLDASNILKPALARGEMQLIGATTFDEYRENIEKDGALARRLLKVMIVEPTLEETKVILKNIRGVYEDHHKVSYSDEIIDSCVMLADRYIQDRAMPDKAIDILDEAGSLTKLSYSDESPKDLQKLEENILTIESEQLSSLKFDKLTAIKDQDFEKASKVRDEERKVLLKLDKLKNELDLKSKDFKTEVTSEIVNKVISTMTSIPLEKLSVQDSMALLSIAPKLGEKVIGQEDAISKVSKAIIRSKSGVKNPSKPLVFMFLGPTGTGKSMLAKEIADQVFGSKDNLIRVDMNEFMEKHKISSLIGAPPGYVGYGEGGKLTEAVRQKPYSVILFDEIEKAHPDIFNLFLQILDEGHITDSNGRKINFKNTLIIMTSNVGVKELSNAGSGLGFQTNPTQNDFRENEIIKTALKKKFPPEFLNRIGETVIFNKLTHENIKNIVINELKHLSDRVLDLGFTLKFNDTLITHLAEIGFEPEYGARPLNRAIETLVEDAVAEEIVGNPTRNKKMHLSYNKTENKIVIK